MHSHPDVSALFDAVMEHRTLEFEFQAIADIGQASVLGYEALMRGPAGSPLRSPDELLRAARSAGRSIELEREACLGAITAFAGLGLPGKLFLNLSAPVIEHFSHDAGRGIRDHAQAAGLSPERLVLELTEHERVEDVVGLEAAVGVLSAHGISLALDDFGDGRSSLRLWTQLKPRIVKLDKYFVRGLQGDSRKMDVVRAVLQLAQALGTPLVAEGIEDAVELAILRDLGCHYAQGYFIGRPAAAPASRPSGAALAVMWSRKPTLPPAPVRPAFRPAAGPHAGHRSHRAPAIGAGNRPLCRPEPLPAL